MTDSQKILVVEDRDDTVAFISEILDDHDYQYSVARNGTEAMAAMRTDPPALVLLDIMMPGKSGMNVYKEMRKDRRLEKIPVVFVSGASGVTGVNLKTGEQESKESYADDFSRGIGEWLKEKLDGMAPDGFIEKPIDPPLLVATIRELLS